LRFDFELPKSPEDGSGRFGVKIDPEDVLEPAAVVEDEECWMFEIDSSASTSTSGSTSGGGLPDEGVDGEGETGSRPGGECIPMPVVSQPLCLANLR
jgi:hypothetical protein